MSLNEERRTVHAELDPTKQRYFYEVACKHDQVPVNPNPTAL